MIPRRIVAVALVALLLQLHLFSRFSFEGARPEILVLLVLAVAHATGRDDGAIVGFGVGLAFDLFLTTPLGFTSLTHLAAGYAMGRFVPEFREAPWWATSMLLAVASSVTMLLQATVGELIGLDTLRGPSVGTIMMLVGLVNLALAPAALAAVRWARHGAGSSRRSSTSVYA